MAIAIRRHGIGNKSHPVILHFEFHVECPKRNPQFDHARTSMSDRVAQRFTSDEEQGTVELGIVSLSGLR